MKKSLFLSVLVISLFLLSVPAQAKTIVFVGGWKMSKQQIDMLSRSFPGCKKFLLPESGWELIRFGKCAKLLEGWLEEENLTREELVFVSFSLGGVITRKMLGNRPDICANTKALILVSSPVGGYWVSPTKWPAFNDEFPKGLKVYVLAGTKSRSSWFLTGGEGDFSNDGAVDVNSALDVPPENLVASALLYVDHTQMLESNQAQDFIKSWLADNNFPINDQGRDMFATAVLK